MSAPDPGLDLIERKVIQLFALVSEALARATEALLGATRGSANRSSKGIRTSTT